MVGRRQVLGMLGVAGAGAVAGSVGARAAGRSVLALAPDEPLPTSPEFDPPFAVDDLDAHVARRLTFGATASVLAEVRDEGREAWIERQLHPEEVAPDPALEAALGEVEALHLSAPELARRFSEDRRRRREAEEAGATRAELQALRRQELRPAGDVVLATVLRAIHAPTQLHELVVDHLSNHFNVHVASSPATALAKVLDDRDVIRPGALGSFADLVVASAKSPAMLAYLDQAESRADGGRVPNENYAREVMELHTLGVDGGYDEDDVLAMAHVLAGWTVTRRTASFTFRSAWHDPGPRTVVGHTTPGRRGPQAVQDGEEVLRHLATHPSTARNVVRRLAVRFVSDTPSDRLVEDVAATFVAHDTELRPTLQHLFTHEEFLASAGRKFKRPLELFASSMRALGWPVPDLADPRAARRLQGMHQALEMLGQTPFGWPAPNGYPDVTGAWLNTGAVLARWNLAQALTGAWDRDGALADGAPPLDLDGTTAEVVARLGEQLHPDGALSQDDLGVVVEAVDAARTPAAPMAAALLLDARPFQYR